jgi:hypothetical protein
MEVRMLPQDIDPSLRVGEPLLESLEDGFSAPAQDSGNEAAPPADAGNAPAPALGPISPF